MRTAIFSVLAITFLSVPCFSRDAGPMRSMINPPAEEKKDVKVIGILEPLFGIQVEKGIICHLNVVTADKKAGTLPKVMGVREDSPAAAQIKEIMARKGRVEASGDYTSSGFLVKLVKEVAKHQR